MAVDPSCVGRDLCDLITLMTSFDKFSSMAHTHLDGFYGIFNLEESAFWAESVDTTIVFASRQKHIGYGASSGEIKWFTEASKTLKVAARQSLADSTAEDINSHP